jgi:HlyD family secretion protein
MLKIIGAYLAVALLAGTSACAQKAKTAPPPFVATAVAALGSIAPASGMSGLIAPYENVAIQSTLAEPADTVEVQEGDHIRKGEVLARLDTADLQAQLDADLATAQSAVANTQHTVYAGNQSITQGDQGVLAARASLTRDQAVLTRDGTLFKQGYISLQAYQADQATVGNDESALRSAQATAQANGSSLNAPGLQSSSVEQSRAQEQVAAAQAEQIRVQIAKATIVSPIDGVVVNRNLNPGEYPGDRQIFTLQQVTPVFAILRGSSDQIVGIANGVAATITASGVRNKLTGTVVGVLNEIQPGSTQFQVKVLVQNANELLRPGMPVQGSVALPAVRGVRIPQTAFTDDNHDSVQVVQADSTAKTIPVREVANDGVSSIVTGISPGTRIVSNGQSSVGDGEKVSFQQ